jgi:hypothetical protein
VNYEEAFEAVRNRDYHAAVPLLEKAVRETDYSSDVVNHAYTIALYHAGHKTQLADFSWRIAKSLLDYDAASALDYFQRAMVAGLDAERVRRIGEVFEKWAATFRRRPHPAESTLTRVAHVIGSVAPSDPKTKYVKMLASILKEQEIESTIFTTEWAASWFFNPERVPISQPGIEADVKIASVEGDFCERAASVADAIRASRCQVAFFHSSLTEQITARVASTRPAPIQISVNHGADMDADLFDGRIHLFHNGKRRTRFSSGPAAWIPPASDINARLQVSEPVTRQGMGLESAGTVSATFGELHALSAGYMRVLSEIMKRFPKHFHLFAGAGNVKAIRAHLHGEGVLQRVRFLGPVSEVAGLLGVIDVYLAAFPHHTADSVLEAMAAGKPVVVLRFPPDSEYNSAAELVGVNELTAPGEADYIEIADRLLRNNSFRDKQGRAMRDRFQAEFLPGRLGERYATFLARFQNAIRIAQ